LEVKLPYLSLGAARLPNDPNSLRTCLARKSSGVDLRTKVGFSGMLAGALVVELGGIGLAPTKE